MLQFASTHGNSWRECVRLFYYSGVKESLAYRGWVTNPEERILQFCVRAGQNRVFQVHARDNGMDVGTFAEFFSSRYTILPPELAPIEPKIIYDIGANIGIASLYFAVRYPRARFYGFEPVPLNLKVCALNYQNLPGARVFRWAVGSRTGKATFELNPRDLRGGRLKGSLPGKQDGLKKQLEVDVFSIIDLIKEQKLEPPEFVKIDVEGAELEVLKGIGNECTSIKRMLIETHGPELEAACFDWVKNHGFEVVHSHSAGPGYTAIWCDRVGPSLGLG